MAGMDPGKEEFAKLDKRVKKLEEEATKYMEGDLSDLAEGLKDDVDSVKDKIDKAKKDSKGRLFKNIVSAGVAALFLGGAAFVFGPKRAGAETLLAYSSAAPEIAYGPSQLDTYIRADSFRGAKEGYVFKMGAEGLGYYLDTGAVAPVEEGPFMVVRNNPSVAVAVGVVGVSIPIGLRGILRKRLQRSSNWPSSAAAAPPFNFAPPPSASPPPASSPPPSSASPSSASSASAPSASASASSPPPSSSSASSSASSSSEAKSPPSVGVGVQDPATMKARELKAAILDLGGNPSGLVEKSELVALLRQLQAEPKVMPTQAYNPSGGHDIDADFANMDPSKLDPSTMQEMMGNPMIEKLSKQMMSDPATMKEFQDAMSSGQGMSSLMNNPSFKKMTENLMQDPEIMKMMTNPAEVNKMMDQMKKMGVKPPPM